MALACANIEYCLLVWNCIVLRCIVVIHFIFLSFALILDFAYSVCLFDTLYLNLSLAIHYINLG